MSTLKTPTGKFLTSVVWGLGIAALFYLACKEGGCLVMKAPENFGEDTYQFGHDCYKFEPYPVTCGADQENFSGAPEIRGKCGSYRYHNVPSYEFPCDEHLQPSEVALTGFDAPIKFDKVSNCKNTNQFQHPHCLWTEHRTPRNCGDPRHERDAECYKHHPMDSIFRAPSPQIYLPQTRN